MAKDNVVSIIPYHSLRDRCRKLLGDVCPDYAFEGEIKNLFRLRKGKIISSEELKEMCEAAAGRRVNGGVSARYSTELEGLIEQHIETQNKD